MNLKLKIAEALTAAAKVNRALMSNPAAILWPDPDRQWQKVVSSLADVVPSLFTLGDYAPTENQGPSIWLKTVLGVTPVNTKPTTIPVIYLPGVSKSDLRAIESCPRALQPLAELQYRGVFWNQSNGKDWTINAFLTSKSGGLGLDVAQDRETQEALPQVLAPGLLLDRRIDDLQSRQINAEWLRSLLTPNPTRDMLVWMNAPQAIQQEWAGVRWDVFRKLAKADFGLDLVSEGPVVAAEKLALREGKWASAAGS